MNILAVDDEELALKDIVRTLKKILPNANIKKASDAEVALALCRRDSFDVAFLDVSMPGMDGLELAGKIKKINPSVNIIMLTAYPQFALDAFKLYASGYLLKPALEDEVRTALDNLRIPVVSQTEGLFVRCFGEFEVFYNGEPVKFGRSKSKELFAFLIHKRGDTVSNADIRAALWGDEMEEENQKKYLTQIVFDLKNKLRELGYGDVLIRSRDSYSVSTTGYVCDYYNALKSDPGSMESYEGEYMERYSWAHR